MAMNARLYVETDIAILDDTTNQTIIVTVGAYVDAQHTIDEIEILCACGPDDSIDYEEFITVEDIPEDHCTEELIRAYEEEIAIYEENIKQDN